MRTKFRTIIPVLIAVITAISVMNVKSQRKYRGRKQPL